MKGWLRWALVAAMVGLSCSAAARADVLIVLNKSDHEAALVDPNTYKVLAKLPTGQGPHEAAVSPDGRWVFVSNYGSFRVFREGERPQMQPGNTVTVIDLKANPPAVKATFDLGEYKQPHGIWVSRDGKLVWVTCEGAQAVLELDAAGGKILRSWKTGQEVSHMVVPTQDEKKLYVANIRSGSVTVIDRTTDAVSSIPTGAGAEGIDLRPDGREVWVTNRSAGTVSVIDPASDKVVATFESGGKFPIRVKFTPDGKQAWVSNAQSNSVTVFDAKKVAIEQNGVKSPLTFAQMLTMDDSMETMENVKLYVDIFDNAGNLLLDAVLSDELFTEIDFPEVIGNVKEVVNKPTTTRTENGGKLPNTATHTTEWALAGAFMMLSALALRKKANANR